MPGLSSASVAPEGEGGGGVAQNVLNLFKRSSHPIAAAFHVAFKLFALLFYFFSSWFASSFVIVFVVVVIANAFDFWTVKNVTGRLMVGLRWWNDVAEDGRSTWRYESIDDPSQVSRADYVIFWYSMYLAALSWGVLGFFAMLKLSLEWLLVCIVSFVLIWSNVYQYWNCSKEAKDRFQQGVQSAISSSAVSALTSVWARGASARVANSAPHEVQPLSGSSMSATQV